MSNNYANSANQSADSLSNTTNPNFANFIALAFVITAIFSVVYVLMRVFMVRYNIEGANFLSADFAQMFIMGARFDMRAICIFTALVVLLGYAVSSNRAILARIGGGKIIKATLSKIASKKYRNFSLNLR